MRARDPGRAARAVGGVSSDVMGHRGSLGLGFALVLLAGCDGGASPAPPAGDAAPEVGVTPAPAVPAVPAVPAPPSLADPASLVGWWVGERTCIELFANGDFEVSDLAEPKVMVMGKASVTAADGGFALALATDRIWKGRYVSRCRKHHETGDFKEEHNILGVRFKPGETGALKLRRTGDETVELCGTICEPLKRETPRLGARWRRANLDSPRSSEATWEVGELLELDLAASLGHVWVGRADKQFGTMYARMTVRHVAADQFVVTLKPERYHVDADMLAETPSALGVAFAVGGEQELRVRRLAGERIEVCGAADRCATLERQFDGYNYDI